MIIINVFIKNNNENINSLDKQDKLIVLKNIFFNTKYKIKLIQNNNSKFFILNCLSDKSIGESAFL